MTLPKFSPKTPLSSYDSYEQNILCYGNPPKGYRWLNVGDATTEKTLLVCSSRITKYPYGGKVRRDQWPAIEPIKTPKAKPANARLGTIGDLRRDALVLEIVKRTDTNVHFKIIKQRSRDIHFIAKDGFLLKTKNFPSFVCDTLFLRGVRREDDDVTAYCFPSDFKRIVVAVREYNDSVRPKPKVVPTPVPPTPLEQIKTLLLATHEIAADVMRECIRTIADRK